MNRTIPVEDHPLHQLARAGLTGLDLVRGHTGEVEIEIKNSKDLERVHTIQVAFHLNGWVRDHDEEGHTKLEHRCYRHYEKSLIARIVVATFDITWAKVTVTKESSRL